jgi:hypothetical protein
MKRFASLRDKFDSVKMNAALGFAASFFLMPILILVRLVTHFFPVLLLSHTENMMVVVWLALSVGVWFGRDWEKKEAERLKSYRYPGL